MASLGGQLFVTGGYSNVNTETLDTGKCNARLAQLVRSLSDCQPEGPGFTSLFES